MKYFKDIAADKIKNKTIILDIDGTITFDGSEKIKNEELRKIKEIGKKNRIYLFSNKKNHKRNQKIADFCKIKYIESPLKKPSKKILDLINHNKNILVIGDKFITDGIFAKNINSEFIKVKRLNSKQDSISTKIIYFLDDILSTLLYRRG